MGIKDILVFLDGSSAGKGSFQLAVNIAQAHRASLSAVFLQSGQAARPAGGQAAPWLGLMPGAPIPGATTTAPSTDLADIAEQQFRDQLRSFKAEGDWYVVDRADTGELVALAQAVDLTVIEQVRPDARPTSKWRPEEIVIGCGRPVLMVPRIGTYKQVGRRVIVAWDGSREAARALHDALPLMSAAEVVTLMTVRAHARGLNQSSLPTGRMLRHLARHGIDACADEAVQSGGGVTDVLLSRSVDLAADMLVAGAYHHSQLREALLGGVSRGLFQHMTLPVLMSH